MIRWLTAVAIALVLIVGGLILATPWLAETALRRGLEAAGFAEGAVAEVDIGWRRAVLEGLTLGEPPQHRVERLVVDYDPFDLVAGRVGAVEAEGVVVRGRIDQHGLQIAGYRPVERDERPVAPAALPERVVVRNGVLELDTPHGPARVPFAGEVVPRGDLADVMLTVAGAMLDADALGRPRADLELRGVVPLAGELRLDRVRADGWLRLDVEPLAVADLATEAGGGATLSFALADGGITVESANAEVELAPLDLPAGLPPGPWQAALGEAGAPLRVEAAPAAEGWAVALDGPIALRSGPTTLAGALSIGLDTDADLALLRLHPSSADLTLRELALGEVALERAELSLQLEGEPEALSGTAALRGTGRDLPAGLPAGPWQAALGEEGAPLRLDLEPADQGWAIALAGPLALRSGPTMLDGTLAVGLETDADLALRRLHPSSADLTLRELALGEVALERAELALRLEGEPRALAGTAAIEGSGRGRPLPELEVATAELAQTLDLALGPDRLTIALREPGRLRLAGASWLDQAAVEELALALRPADAPLLELDRETGDWRSAVEAGLEALALRAGDPAAPLDVLGRIGRVDLRAEGTADGLRTARLAVADADLRLPEHALSVEGLASEVTVANGALAPRQTFLLRVAEIRHGLDPPWFPPSAIEGRWRSGNGLVSFEGRVAPLAGGVSLQVSGSHDPAAGSGRATLALDPVTFAPGGVQPLRLVPALARQVSDVAGLLDADGELRWDADGLDGTLSVLLEDLSLTTGPARIEGLSGVVRLDHLLPPSTPPDQRLSVTRLDIGLPLTDGLLTFQLEPDALLVERLRFRFAGGTLRAAPFRVGSAETVIPVTLTAQGLDLAQILEQTQLAGLSGEGTIDGTLPITISGTEAVVRGGQLRARSPGWLRYRPDDPPAAFAAGGEGMELLLQALENFRYEELRITLDGRTDAEMDADLHLRGANPGLYDGYPIEFNLSLGGELANILRTGLGTWGIPEAVRERMEQRPPGG
jgi:hypothetical protein